MEKRRKKALIATTIITLAGLTVEALYKYDRSTSVTVTSTTPIGNKEGKTFEAGSNVEPFVSGPYPFLGESELLSYRELTPEEIRSHYGPDYDGETTWIEYTVRYKGEIEKVIEQFSKSVNQLFKH